MPTTQDLQNLANGSFGQPNASSSNAQGATIVVTNPVVNDGSCLSCDEGAACTVNPTQAVILDLGAFQQGGAQVLRFNIVSNPQADPHKLNFLANYTTSNYIDYAIKKRTFLEPNQYQDMALNINGEAAGAVVSDFLKVITGGAFVSKITIRANTTVAANQTFMTNSITGFHFPIDNNVAVQSTINYDPFCDCCLTTNNGDFSTHCYTGAFPITWRDGFQFLVPGGVNAVIELCFSIIDLPNTAASPAAVQWG